MFLGLFFVLAFGNLASAETIGQGNIEIRIYNNTLELKNPNYDGDDQTWTLNITDDLITLQEITKTILFVRNESVDRNIVDQYTACQSSLTSCLVDKRAFESSWNECRKDLEDYTGENATICQDNLEDVQNQLDDKSDDYDHLVEDKNDLQDELDATKNQKWTYGGFGAALGALAFYFYKKREKDGGPKPKSHEDEFNKRQAS